MGLIMTTLEPQQTAEQNTTNTVVRRSEVLVVTGLMGSAMQAPDVSSQYKHVIGTFLEILQVIGLLLYSVHGYFMKFCWWLLVARGELNISHTDCGSERGENHTGTLSALMDGNYMDWREHTGTSWVSSWGSLFVLNVRNLTGISSVFSDLICWVASFPPGLNEVLTVAEIF